MTNTRQINCIYCDGYSEHTRTCPNRNLHKYPCPNCGATTHSKCDPSRCPVCGARNCSSDHSRY